MKATGRQRIFKRFAPIAECRLDDLKEHGFIMGGIFPPKDASNLKEMGFSGAFLSATKEEIVSCIEEAVAARRN